MSETHPMSVLVHSDDPRATDARLCGTKAAALARVAALPPADRPRTVPWAVLTTDAWRRVVSVLGVRTLVDAALGGDDRAAHELAGALRAASLPPDVVRAVQRALAVLDPGGTTGVAVRSSAIAEDLAGRSFAGQYRTTLCVAGVDDVLAAYRDCLASAWEPATMAYRSGVSVATPDDPSMAVMLQPMVHSGDGLAGAAIGEGTGAVTVELVDGLGDALMSGAADPAHHLVGPGEVHDDPLVAGVVAWVRRAERVWGGPVEVEFAVDHADARPVVLQVRPHAPPGTSTWSSAAPGPSRPAGGLVEGLAVGSGVVRGQVCRLDGPEQAELMVPGGVVVTASTDPAWVPLLAAAGAVVTDHGGTTSHAAIVCRELGLLAVVGCGDATGALSHGQLVEVRCEGGRGTVLPSA